MSFAIDAECLRLIDEPDLKERLAIEIHDADLWDLIDFYESNPPTFHPLELAWDLRRHFGDAGRVYFYELMRVWDTCEYESQQEIDRTWAATDRPGPTNMDQLLVDTIGWAIRDGWTAPALEIAAALKQLRDATEEGEFQAAMEKPVSHVPMPANWNALEGRKSLITGARPQLAPPEYGETEIADRFVKEFGCQLSFIKSRNQWLHWNGKRWIVDSKGFVNDLAAKHCKAESALCRSTPGYTDANARALCSAKTINAVLRIAGNDQRIATEAAEWDQDPWLIGVPDGVVDLRMSTLRPARPEDRVTKSTSVTPGGDCPAWLAFLHRATGGDVDLQAYLQRMCGYFLSGSTREESLHFAYGPGGAGKGTFTHAITGIMHDYHCATAIATFTETKQDRHLAEIAVMQGARLVTCSETERGRHWAESRIKEMTGSDPITARFMNGNPFNFVPTFKILVSGNYRPHLRPDSAMRRRFLLVPFSHGIPTHEVDRELGHKLEREWPGILRG